MSPPPSAGLIIQHEADAPAGHLADWLVDRGIAHSVLPVWESPLPEDPTAYAWICSLGSEHTPGRDSSPAWVDAEISFLRRAIDADVPDPRPLLRRPGARQRGGRRRPPLRSRPRSAGSRWRRAIRERIPPGPWLHFHYDQLELPDGAVELARSPAGTAAFELGPHLGLQFHPETTPEIADDWARSERATLDRLGIGAEELAEQARRSGEGARNDARRLFDAWWARLDGRG